MIPTITVRVYSDNVEFLILKNKGAPVNLRGLTSVQLCTDDSKKISSIDHPDAFDWLGQPKGVLKLKLGHVLLDTGIINAQLSVYDGLNPNGLYFGSIRLRTIRGC